MRVKENAMGRGAVLAVVATVALFAIVAVTAPGQASLQQAQLAQSLPSWSVGPSAQQHTLKNQVHGKRMQSMLRRCLLSRILVLVLISALV